MDTEEYDKAQEEINKALAVNPKSAEAFSLLASISFVRNNTDDFNKYVKQVLETNPHYSKLYDSLAENCEHLRLYKESVAFAREALKINPSDWNAMSMLGINLMRIGEEEDGKQVLDQAFKGDPFNQTELQHARPAGQVHEVCRVRHAAFQGETARNRSRGHAAVRRRNFSRRRTTRSARSTVSNRKVRSSSRCIRTTMTSPCELWDCPGSEAHSGVCFGKLFVMDSPAARKPDAIQLGQYAVARIYSRHHASNDGSQNSALVLRRPFGLRGAQSDFLAGAIDLKLDYLEAIKAKKLLPDR